MTRTALSLFLLTAVACTPKPQDAQLVVDTSLADSFENMDLVGVAVDPDTGAVSVLDANEGLFRLEDGDLIQTASPETLQRDGEDLRPYTDVVAMGGGEFAVTVRNDGLLLNVPEQVTTQHFCYLPGSEVDEGFEGVTERSQLTHAVAYDAEGDVLFAQPQTFDGVDVVGAQVGTYAGLEGGQPESWFEFKKEDISATAMAWDGDRLLMAMGTELYSYTLGDDKPRRYVDLSELGLGGISGMAIRPDDTLVVVRKQSIQEVTGWRP